MIINYQKKSAQWFVLLLLAFIWGSSFILMKRGLDSFNDTQVAALRIIITCLSLLPFAIKYISKINRKIVWALFASAALGNGIPAFLFTKAETGISSAMTGILNSLTPLFALIIGLMFFKMKTGWLNIVGVFISLLGTVLLLSSSGEAGFNQNLFYGLFVVVATLCYSINVNIVNKYFHQINAVTIVSVGFLFIGPVAAIYLFTTDFVNIMKESPEAWASLGYVAILAAIGTAFAVVLYNNLMKNTSVLFPASVTYIIPIFALLWGLIDGERISIWDVLNTLIIFIGVYLVRTPNKVKSI